MNIIHQLPENTTISKMETVGNRGFRKHFKVVKSDHFKSIEFDGFKRLLNYDVIATPKYKPIEFDRFINKVQF